MNITKYNFYPIELYINFQFLYIYEYIKCILNIWQRRDSHEYEKPDAYKSKE